MGSKVDLKIVFLGRENGGKTCVVTRFLRGTFPDEKKKEDGTVMPYQAVRQTKALF